MQTKKLFSVFLALVLAFGLTSASFAQENSETTNNSLLSFEEEKPYIMENDSLLFDSLENTARRFLSNANTSELPPESVFELLRVRVALDVGMDLDTFLFGDIGEWSDNYLREWRRENGIAEIPYDGDMYVRLSSAEGDVDVHSMETHEYLGTIRQSQEELDLLSKIFLLRVPYTFHLDDSEGDTRENRLIQLMNEIANIQSVDELLESLPLEQLEETMIRENLSVSDIAVNWLYHENSDNHANDRQNITPLSSNLHTQVTNTTATAFRPVSHLHVKFPNDSRMFHGSGFVFGVHNAVMTVGHNIYYPKYGGWAEHITVSPGRNGDNFHYGSNKTYYEPFFSPWIIPLQWFNNGNSQHDWGIINAGDFNLGGSRFWLSTSTNSQLVNFTTTMIGYPGNQNGFMFRSTGSASLPTATSFEFTNYTVRGYSGSPITNPAGGVVGIARTLSPPHGGIAVRINEALYNWNFEMIF